MSSRAVQEGVFLEAARKSVPDPVSGRVRCLSCGSIFKSMEALADHLKKHGGVNSRNYVSAKIVGGTKGAWRKAPTEKRPVLVKDKIIYKQHKPDKPQRPSKKPTDFSSRGGMASKQRAEDMKGPKKNKTTAAKKSILITNVLNLRESLESLEREAERLGSEERPTLQEPEIKKEIKRIKGAINSASAELKMALASLNRRLSFRQLVKLEYLTNQMELVSSGDLQGPIEEVPKDVPLVGDCLMQLYEDATVLGDQIETFLDEKWKLAKEAPPVTDKTILERNIESVDFSAKLDKDTSTEESLDQKTDVSRCIEESESPSCDVGEMEGHYSTSSEDSGNFGNILMEWAKKSKYRAAPSISRRPDLNFSSVFSDEDKPQQGTREPRQAPISRSVTVVHAKKSATHQLSEFSEYENEEIGSSGPTCVFIRPDLAFKSDRGDASVSSDPSKSNLRKRSTPVKKTVEGGSVDEDVLNLLSRLNHLQHVHMRSEKGDRKDQTSKKWTVNGFSEVGRHLDRGTVKLVILAQNLGEVIQPDIDKLMTKAAEKEVPVVIALSRKKIGCIYHPRKKMSVVGVLDCHSAEEAFEKVLHRATIRH